MNEEPPRNNSRPPLPQSYPRHIIKDSLSESESSALNSNRPPPIIFKNEPFSEDSLVDSDDVVSSDDEEEEKPE